MSDADAMAVALKQTSAAISDELFGSIYKISSQITSNPGNADRCSKSVLWDFTKRINDMELRDQKFSTTISTLRRLKDFRDPFTSNCSTPSCACHKVKVCEMLRDIA